MKFWNLICRRQRNKSLLQKLVYLNCRSQEFTVLALLLTFKIHKSSYFISLTSKVPSKYKLIKLENIRQYCYFITNLPTEPRINLPVSSDCVRAQTDVKQRRQSVTKGRVMSTSGLINNVAQYALDVNFCHRVAHVHSLISILLFRHRLRRVYIC